MKACNCIRLPGLWIRNFFIIVQQTLRNLLHINRKLISIQSILPRLSFSVSVERVENAGLFLSSFVSWRSFEISSESGDSISLTEVLTLNVAPKSIEKCSWYNYFFITEDWLFSITNELIVSFSNIPENKSFKCVLKNSSSCFVTVEHGVHNLTGSTNPIRWNCTLVEQHLLQKMWPHLRQWC